MRGVFKNFLKGLVIVVPLVTTIYLVWLPVTFFDRLIRAPYPGIGLALTLIVIWTVGLFASNRLGGKLVLVFESLIAHLPVLKILYSTVKDFVVALAGEKRRFDKPVVVELQPGIKALGFLTREELDAPELAGLIAVYLPQSYNFAGQTILVPRERVVELDVDPGRIMTLIVSAGVTGHEGHLEESGAPAGHEGAARTPTKE